MVKELKKIVCTVGGGSGMPIVNKALIEAGYERIRSIVTTFDNGGDTGRMRTDERGKILAFSDYWRSLISLWKDGKQKEIWEEMLQFRDGRGRNFGNMFFQFMTERNGTLSDVDSLFSQLTGAGLKGKVIPVSVEPADICFITEGGKEYQGEHFLDDLRMSLDRVRDVWLEPKVKANKEAIEALTEASVIILCPGSMYGSVLTNMLPEGMGEAYRCSKAVKILMTNLMSVANENDGFSQKNYVDVFKKYLGNNRPFDWVLMANFDCLDKVLLAKVLKNYEMEHSKPIEKSEVEDDFRTLVIDIAKIEEKNLRLRHSVTKLSRFFGSKTWKDLLK